MQLFSRRHLTLAALCATAGWSLGVGAQTAGTVRLLVGFPAGGTGDVVARLVADKVSAKLGTPVIVENKPGAGGRIAAEALKNAAADGNTVMIAPPASIVIAPYTFRKLAYNPETDFQPIAQLVRFPLAIAVGGSSPHKNLGDLTAWFKKHPQQAAFGTSAAGSQLHFLGVMYGQATKIDLTHVPYQGSAPLMNDLIGGQVPAGIDQFQLELHKSGKIRLLATSGDKRSPLTPDVPTFQEQGVPIEGDSWFGAFMHAKVAPARAQQLGEALAEAARQPDVVQKLAAAGLEATGMKPAEFTAFVAADRARWKPVVEASGFRAD